MPSCPTSEIRLGGASFSLQRRREPAFFELTPSGYAFGMMVALIRFVSFRPRSAASDHLMWLISFVSKCRLSKSDSRQQ
jgi:uncharacterized RDD family membrane protein YckC